MLSSAEYNVQSFRGGSKMSLPVAKVDGISLSDELEVLSLAQKSDTLAETIKMPHNEEQHLR